MKILPILGAVSAYTLPGPAFGGKLASQNSETFAGTLSSAAASVSSAAIRREDSGKKQRQVKTCLCL